MNPRFAFYSFDISSRNLMKYSAEMCSLLVYHLKKFVVLLLGLFLDSIINFICL